MHTDLTTKSRGEGIDALFFCKYLPECRARLDFAGNVFYFRGLRHIILAKIEELQLSMRLQEIRHTTKTLESRTTLVTVAIPKNDHV
jgi:hypothetical protein